MEFPNKIGLKAVLLLIVCVGRFPLLSAQDKGFDFASLEILVPKGSASNSANAFGVIQNLVTAALQTNAQLIQDEYASQVEILNAPLERSKSTHLPVLASWIDKNRDLVMAQAHDKEGAKRMLDELRGLELVVDVSFRISPGISQVKTEFPLDSKANSSSILQITTEAKAKVQLEIIKLAIGFENPIVGDAVDVEVPAMAEEGNLVIQSDPIRMKASIDVRENLSERQDVPEAPILRLPLIGFESNLKSVKMNPNSAKDIVARFLKPEQLSAALAAMAELETLNRLTKFGSQEIENRLQSLDLKMTLIVALKISEKPLFGTEAFEYFFEKEGPAADALIQDLDTQKRLLFVADLNLPIRVRKFSGQLDLKGLKLEAQVVPPKTTELELKPRVLKLPSELFQAFNINGLEELILPLQNLNLAAIPYALKLRLGFSDALNHLKLPLKFVGPDLQWDDSEFALALPFLEKIEFQDFHLQNQAGQDEISLDLSATNLDSQALLQIPKVIEVFQKITENSLNTPLESFLVNLIQSKIDGLKNIQVDGKGAGPSFAVEIRSCKLPEKALKLNWSPAIPKAESDPEIYRLGLSLELPREIKIALKNIQTNEADIEALNIRVLNASKEEMRVQASFRALLETRTQEGKLQYRIRHEVEEAQFLPRVEALEIGPSTLDLLPVGVTPKGQIGEVLKWLEQQGREIGSGKGQLGTGIQMWTYNEKLKAVRSILRAEFEKGRAKLASEFKATVSNALNGSSEGWSDFSSMPGFAEAGVSGLLKFEASTIAQSLRGRMEVNWREVAEGKLKAMFFANVHAGETPQETSETKALNSIYFPGNKRLKEIRTSMKAGLENWLIEAIASNAESLEESFKGIYNQDIAPKVESVSTERLAALETAKIPVVMGGSAPPRNFDGAIRERLMEDERLKAAIHLSYLNEFLNQNLEVLQKMLEGKAKESAFVNRSFELQLSSPRSSNQRFFFINGDGKLEFRMGLQISQDTIAIQALTGVFGYILDGPLSLLFGKDINVFRKIFSVVGMPFDALGGLITDLNTRKGSELRVVVDLGLLNKEEKYALQLKIIKIELAHCDPVTLLTTIVADWALPSTLEGSLQQLEIPRPQLPVFNEQVSFDLIEGNVPLLMDEGRQAVLIALQPVYHFNVSERPTLLYDAEAHSKDEEVEPAKSTPPPPVVPASEIKMPEFSLIRLRSPSETDFYEVFASIESDDGAVLKSRYDKFEISAADYLQLHFQHSLGLDVRAELERKEGYSERKGIVDLMIGLNPDGNPKEFESLAHQLKREPEEALNLASVMSSVWKQNRHFYLRQFLPEIPLMKTGQIPKQETNAFRSVLLWHGIETSFGMTSVQDFEDFLRRQASEISSYQASLQVGDIVLVSDEAGNVQDASIYINRDFVWRKRSDPKTRFEFLETSKFLSQSKSKSERLRVKIYRLNQ